MNQYALAEECFSRALQIEQNSHIRRLYADALLQQERLPEAMSQYQQIVVDGSKNDKAHAEQQIARLQTTLQA